jgi:hypothetical protein
VHVLEVCGTITGCDEEQNVDVGLGVQLLKSQFISALDLWKSPSLDSIWGDSRHRVAIHLRRGDIRHDPDRSMNCLSSQRVAKALGRYLWQLGVLNVSRTVVVVLAETSATDPELKPLRDLESQFHGLRMTWLLGEPQGWNMDDKRVQQRVARDLFVMSSSTALFMSESSFSILGAMLQDSTAVRFAPLEDNQEGPSMEAHKLHWRIWRIAFLRQTLGMSTSSFSI